MDPEWILFAAYMLGCPVIGLLVWLLLPSSAYRKVKQYARNQSDANIHRWSSYRSVKRLVTPLKIVMNAVQDPSFTKADLEKLNELLAKLEQPAAAPIKVEVGARFDAETMTAADRERENNRGLRHVLEERSFGVKWRGEVLKKASVTRCTPDRLMMLRLPRATYMADNKAGALATLVNHKKDIPPDFKLDASWLQGFIDTCIDVRHVSQLFAAFKDMHPENDFVIYSPRIGQAYNNDTMITLGDRPGHRCWVQEVIHPGLHRNSDKAWRIRALVRIKNPSRHEV
jgi:hypothetical protein